MIDVSNFDALYVNVITNMQTGFVVTFVATGSRSWSFPTEFLNQNKRIYWVISL